MSARAIVASCLVALSLGALSTGPASAADECDGLRVCLPVAGPWVVVPTGAGVEYELTCPLPGYVIAGTDARAATKDVDVSVRGEIGSPVSPGVTTRRTIVFHAQRTRPGGAATSFQPFIGCIPTSGGGGRALTGLAAAAAGIKPSKALFSVVRDTPLRRSARTVRVSCPKGSQRVGASHAIAFRQPLPPTAAQREAVRVRRSILEDVVVARVVATPAAGFGAEVQLRAVCARVP